MMRSWLFIPADSSRKLAKAATSGADVILFDLEDSVALAQKPLARDLLQRHLSVNPPATRPMPLYVRINPLADSALSDLAQIMQGAPDGIMLPKTFGAACVTRLSCYLDAFEAAFGLEHGRTKIIAIVNETARGALNLHEFADLVEPRLIALTWGAEDLAAAVGARSNMDASGQLSLVYQISRANVLLAAKAAGLIAIDAISADFKDIEALRASSAASANDGFDGRLAIHPAQVGPINEGFTPSVDEINHAHRVIAAFDAQASAGAVGLDGKMLDLPHLKQARQLLARC